MQYIIRPQDSNAADRLGGKARALARLQAAGLPIPPWFVVGLEAFYASLTETERQALQTVQNSSEALKLIEHLRPSHEVALELSHALAELCPKGELVAVRSSARDEDSPQYSFAGQLESFLFVRPHEVADKVAAVWRSGFSQRIFAYRREHGLSLTPRPPSVLIQRMINAEAAGVAFGADPVSGRRSVAVVAALYGLGTALVSGECDADTYHVDLQGQIIKRDIAYKRLAHRCDPDAIEGVRRVALSKDEAGKPALSDEQIQAVAQLVRETGKHFGRPQDIEWAIEGGRLYLLQSRPITSLSQIADPDGALNLWDNSNIAESYSGVTTPLTFSFARYVYEEVYRQFCIMMKVPMSTIQAHVDTFQRMLGLIRGRVYYNLLSWYRVLAMLPGFTVNRRFMEQMMGVKEGLPDQIVAEISQASWRARFKDGFNLMRTIGGLIANHFLLPRRIKSFYKRLDQALGPARSALADLRADELAADYRELEQQLLTRWDAPLINDFFAMIFYGVLRRLTEKWCADAQATLQNDLLCGEGGMISTEPAKRVRQMAEIAARDVGFVVTLCEGSPDAIRHCLEQFSDFKSKYEDHLNKFGDRCLEELKLESPTLHDDPLPLLRSIGQLARRLGLPDAMPAQGIEIDMRRRAEERVRKALHARPIRRTLFYWVLRHARVRVRERENLRFERTRLFGRVRRIFVEIGRRLFAADLLEDPRDVFYLELDEVLGFVEGTTTCTDLKGLIAVRKAEFARYRESEAPADRFETRGIVHQGNSFKGADRTEEASSADQCKGIGCCPGIVRGPVRVITDPRSAVLRTGEILVAERTDPGWIMLFPAAAGLLVERGSLLSHSAIVSREMGIPAIVSIEGVTRWLKDGDWVELDGSTGVVRRIRMDGDAQ
jgi:pyruvate,water dikinase